MSAMAPAPGAPRAGVLAAVGGTDHKVVAWRMVAAAGVFFLAGGLLALVMRTELAEPGLQIVSNSGYAQLFTMHGSTMVFLVVTPVALAFCVYLVPLQIGAAEIAGARWVSGGSWLGILGGTVMWLGWLTATGAASAGWYAYDPLNSAVNTPGNGMDLWMAGVMLVTAGHVVVAACVLATLLRRRAPGMTLLRVPVFAWTALATCLLVLFAFPSLVVAFGLELLDRHGAHILDPVSYQQLFWFYGHPAVYVMFFPFVGMVGEAASVFAARRFFGYHIFVLGLLGFAAGSMSVWAHHMFSTGAVPNKLFSLTSTSLAVFAGIEYFDIIGTLWRGTIRFTTSLLFVVGFLVQFLIGGLTGVWIASPTLDYQATDSYFIVAHFHYTLFGGSLFGLFAGLYLWWPKLTGRFLSERLGKLHFAGTVIGFNLTFMPQFVLGADGMARRLSDYPAGAGWTTLNLVSTIGAFVLGAATLVFLVAVLASFAVPPSAPDDAWGTGNGLEWYTSSPPPRHNFDALPPIRSYAPLFDLRHPEEDVPDRPPLERVP